MNKVPSISSENDILSKVQGVALCVAVDADGPLVGVLLLGESGVGKSSLALSLIGQCPWQRSALVADDMVIFKEAQGGLMASAPMVIKGLIEVYGFGPLPVRCEKQIMIKAAFSLTPQKGARIRDIEQWSPPNMSPIIPQTIPLWPYQYDTDSPEISVIDHNVRIRSILRSFLSGHTL